MMRNEEMKAYADQLMANQHWKEDQFHWEDDVLTDGEIEYQFRKYHNGDFRSLLVRFCDDITHSYREFFIFDYEENWWELLEEAMSEETKDFLADLINRKIAKRLSEV